MAISRARSILLPRAQAAAGHPAIRHLSSAKRAVSNYLAIVGLSRHSDRADLEAFLAVAFADHAAGALGGHTLHPTLESHTMMPTGDWVVRVTDEQAAVGALAQIAKKGHNVVVGSKKVVTRKLDASSGQASVAAATVQLTVPSRAEAEWKARVAAASGAGGGGGGSGGPSSPAAPPAWATLKPSDPSLARSTVTLDGRVLRVLGLPLHYGVDEVEYMFRGFAMAEDGPAVSRRSKPRDAGRAVTCVVKRARRVTIVGVTIVGVCARKPGYGATSWARPLLCSPHMPCNAMRGAPVRCSCLACPVSCARCVCVGGATAGGDDRVARGGGGPDCGAVRDRGRVPACAAGAR